MADAPNPEETDSYQRISAVLDWVNYHGDRTAVIGQLSIYHDWLATEATAAGGIGPDEAGRLWRRHLADSLTFLSGLMALERDAAEKGAVGARISPADFAQSGTATQAAAGGILDVGSGVGLPGIPLAIALPHIRFTLLDRSGRRCDLAGRAVRILELDNADVLQGDATEMRLPHTVAVSRAVIAPGSFKAVLQRLLPNGKSAIVGGSYGTAPPDDADFEVIRVPQHVLSGDGPLGAESTGTVCLATAEGGTAWLAKLSLSS